MVRINLLPKEIIEKQRLERLMVLCVLCVLIIVAISLIVFGLKASTLPALNSASIKLDREIKQLQPIIDEVNKLKSVKADLESRKQLVEQLEEDSLTYPKFMVILLKALPEGVWIENFQSVVEKAQDKTISSMKVTINAKSYDKFSIADFISNLENKPDIFTDVKLGSIQVEPSNNYELHSFSISFKYIVKK